jgi:putative SOS response-associated peptidase YedK
MCGRYTLVKISELPNLFPWITHPPEDVPARYNIAPTQPILAVASDHPDRYEFLQWGLVPWWAKEPAVGHKMINARGETLADRPAFRDALKRRRCLIPADGFYEWRRNADGKTKTPMLIRLKNGRPFALAGLWETWTSPDGSELRSATIITTRPNELMKDIHDRMPVIMPPGKLEAWLERKERSPEELGELIATYPAEEMEAFEVSKTVNNPRNEEPGCAEPVPKEKTGLWD